MKHTAVALLAACTVALAASCASAPRAAHPSGDARPLTIEMFDSRAVTAPTSREAAFRLELPAVPEAEAAASPAPAAAAAAVPAVSPAAAAASREEAPAPATAPDASLRAPLRPRVKASFRLETPAAPAPAPAAPVAAGAPRPAPLKAAPPRPAPAKPAPAAGQQAAAPVAPKQPAASSAAGATGGSSSAAAGAAGAGPGTAGSTGAGSGGSAPYGRLREIYARQGDELQIGLDGVGFLFLGLPDAQGDGMSFKSKENRANKTLFTFQALKLGTYDLDFLQQDNMAGRSSRETVRVHVVSDQDFAAATAAAGGQDQQGAGIASAGSSQDSGDAVFAQKLAAAGSYPAAVAELLKGYREGNPGLNDQIAALYLKMGSYDAAEKYWTRNLAPQGDFTARAVVGLFRVSVLQNDQQGLLTYLRPFLALSDPSMEEPLMQAVRMEKARSETGLALDLAGEYARRFPSGAWRDEADFLTAQLLEADSPFRDLARARQLYQAILADRPESPFADAARQRAQYIDRHFFDVR